MLSRSFLKLKNSFKIFISTNSKPLPLGRWGLIEEEQRIKAAFANHDNCGANSCRDPREVKRLLEDEKIFKK